MSEHQTDDRPARSALAHYKQGHDMNGGALGAASAQERDPVCGMKIDPAKSKHRFEHDGETFHFCSAGCQTKFAASVVIIACPCPFGLATPMSIMVAVAKGAGAGVLIKSAESLERMEMVDTLVVDKTGTLTEGKPKVTSVVPAPRLTEDDLLQLAASLERSSEHPLAAAGLAAAKEKNITAEEPTNFGSVTGKGVPGKVGGRPISLGDAKLMSDHGIELGKLAGKADELRGSGATVFFFGVDGKVAGIIAIADPVRATTRAALDSLRADGIHIGHGSRHAKRRSDPNQGRPCRHRARRDAEPDDHA